GRVRKLLTTSSTKGTLRFSRMEGPAGERVIEASVRGSGGERLRTIVARYTAKSPVRPGTVRSLKLRRSGSVVRLSWKAPRGEKPARYSVVFRTKDGRQIVDSVSRPKSTIDGLARKTSGKVSVIALGKSGIESRPARVTLPKRR
ncbi:MAG: hypothetical protein Q7T55_00175, partial [Solirubrobacteraceae bacterium]|nr:hypothetical protein [Solirubrobacteraceae bacterium]